MCYIAKKKKNANGSKCLKQFSVTSLGTIDNRAKVPEGINMRVQVWERNEAIEVHYSIYQSSLNDQRITDQSKVQIETTSRGTD